MEDRQGLVWVDSPQAAPCQVHGTAMLEPKGVKALSSCQASRGRECWSWVWGGGKEKVVGGKQWGAGGREGVQSGEWGYRAWGGGGGSGEGVGSGVEREGEGGLG